MAEFSGGPLTILFRDVEGSTDLRTERGDAPAHRILRSHEDVVRRCVADHDGREIKALGDGFMVAFASVRKGLDARSRSNSNWRIAPLSHPAEVRVHIGINFGEVTVEGDDLYGQAVNAAARIASRAKGGEILVSDIVRQLAGSGPDFTFADRGRLRLKGFPPTGGTSTASSTTQAARSSPGVGMTPTAGTAGPPGKRSVAMFGGIQSRPAQRGSPILWS